ncbi:Hypothetical predicted protein [Cloeon dipterum]|uniref:Uncharacterized protein n=1 Tax=Cloeon dipterum TaxID=197152 RepID=A0A8S1EAE0_9INSE|nr:Hypothetical predicted protein [Cloeon dipterum]
MVDKLLWIDMDKRKNVVTMNMDQMQEENVDIDTTMLKGTFFKQKIQNMTVSMQGGIQFQTTDRNLKVIAPLFAEFDRKHGQIIYRAVDNSVTVQWKDLKLDHEDYLEDKFSFQATLFDDGKIEFVYKEVPSTLKPVNRGSKSLFLGFYGVAERNLDEILDENSKNKESNLEFDSDIGGHPIHVGTVIYLVPNPSCSAFTQCQQCSGRVISTSPFSASSCAWRPSTNTCVQSVKTSKNGFRFDTSMKPLTTARQECLDYEWGIVEWIIYSNSTLFLIALAGVFACMTFLFCFYLE